VRVSASLALRLNLKLVRGVPGLQGTDNDVNVFCGGISKIEARN
jgi:hypothetical protein